MDTLVCPKGHQSTDHDYCSDCGAKIANEIANGNGTASGAGPLAAVFAGAEVCPDCGTKREHRGVTFCEICGYNFTTGARGEVPVNFSPVAEAAKAAVVPEESPEPVRDVTSDVAIEAPAAGTSEFSVEVSIDRSAKQADSPEPPVGFSAFTVELSKLVNLIGRTSQTRAIFPEIAIDHDDAVSHRHALLQFDSDGALSIRDIGAANGTMVNGKEIAAMIDHPLQDGDEITLGHWSKIQIRLKAVV